MKWWPWRREPDGEDARAKRAEANEQLDAARAQGRKVSEAARAAHAMARQVDRYARDVEQALRLRGIM